MENCKCGQRFELGGRVKMNERYQEVLEQYEVEILSVRKGRGAWICETDKGLKLLREYKGTVRRLEFEDQVLECLDTRGSLRADQRLAESVSGRSVFPRRSGSLRRRRPAAKVRPFCRIRRVGTAAWLAVRDAGEKAASGVRPGRGRCLHRRDHPDLRPRPQPRHPGRVH